MNKKVDIFESAYLAVIFYAITAFIGMSVFGDNYTYATITLLIILPVIVSNYVIKKELPLKKFLLIDVVPIIIMALVPVQFSYRLLLIAFTVFLMIFAVVCKMGEYNNAFGEPTYKTGIVIAILYFLAYRSQMPNLMNILYVCMILFAAAIILYENASGLYVFIKTNRDSYTIPKRELIFVNMRSCILLLGSMAISVLFIRVIRIDHILAGIIRLIRNIFLRPLNSDKMTLSEDDILVDTAGTAEITDQVYKRPSEYPKSIEIFVAVITVTVVAVAVLLMIYLIYRLYKNYSYMKGDNISSEDGDIEEEEEIIARTSLDRKKKRFMRWDFSPSGKIRHLYYKRIKKQKKKDTYIERTHTPDEIEKAVGLEDELLHRQYEKARYGNNICTKDDFEALK